MFKKLRSVNLPEEEQGFIYFTCATYWKQPEEIREKIDQLCIETGGEYYQALRDVMLRRKGLTLAAIDSGCSENTLISRRKNFFESWGNLR